MVSYASGCIYVFHDELPCSPGPPSYQLVKQVCQFISLLEIHRWVELQGEKFSVFTCKNKSTRNPLFKWQIGDKPITQFAFTTDGRMLATVSTVSGLFVCGFKEFNCAGRLFAHLQLYSNGAAFRDEVVFRCSEHIGLEPGWEANCDGRRGRLADGVQCAREAGCLQRSRPQELDFPCGSLRCNSMHYECDCRLHSIPSAQSQNRTWLPRMAPLLQTSPLCRPCPPSAFPI